MGIPLDLRVEELPYKNGLMVQVPILPSQDPTLPSRDSGYRQEAYSLSREPQVMHVIGYISGCRC